MQIRALRPWVVAVSLILVGNYAAFYLFRVSAWSELECFEWLALFLSVICFGAGLGSLNLARPTVSGIAVTSLSASHSQASPRFSLRPRFHRLPPFGLIGSLGLFLVIVPLWMMQFGDLPSKGLSVDLVRPGLPAQATPWPEAIRLRIDVHNRWYLNDALTSGSALPNALKAALSRRAQWVVYIEADPDVPYGGPVAAMEIVRAAHARVILLTPQSSGNGGPTP